MAHQRNVRLLFQHGWGLAEVMVGLAIGLITTLIITQIIVNFEGQKRTTSGNADAQINGSVALYTIQRQAQMAGFGLPVFSQKNQPLNCALTEGYDHDADAATPVIGLFPAVAIDGGASGASDTLIIRGGTSPMGGAPLNVAAVAGNVVGVDNNLSCKVGDIAFASHGATCAMTTVQKLTGTAQIELKSTTDIMAGSTLGCMAQWVERTYQVNGGNLTEAVGGGVAAPRVSGIVNIQVQYGISDEAASNQVTAWVDASGADWAKTTTTPTVANRNRIKAIRIAVVARNGSYEANKVTGTCTTSKGVVNKGPCAWDDSSVSAAPKIDLSSDPKWEHYRYRVFETIVPLRNILWSKDML